MERISVKFECKVCLAIFSASFSEEQKDQVKCPECGRKKLTIKKRKVISMDMTEQAIKKLDNERQKEIEEAKNNNEKIATHERDPIHREEIRHVPAFQCVNCIHKFDFDIKRGEPSCPKCGSVEIASLKPKVRFISVPDPIILSKTERKKIQFIRNGYKNFKNIQYTGEGLLNIFQRSGISEKRFKLLKRQLEIALNELEIIQDKKLKTYDKIIESRKEKNG